MFAEPYEVQLTRKAQKDLDDYRGFACQVIDELLVLENDPLHGHPSGGTLRGCRSLEFSLVDGAHRAAYVILEHPRSVRRSQ